MYGLTTQELKVLRSLNTAPKIQDFLDALPINFEKNGETYMSPRRVLRERTAHCMEGAMLAALAFRLEGHKPLVMDLKVTDEDDDHVIAVFQRNGLWGAISKTNHGTCRYRDPIYRNIRELAMTYFHEYAEPKGKKILRSYSRPVDLSRFDKRGWMTAEEEIYYVPEYIDAVRHYDVLPNSSVGYLRLADAMERRIGAVLEWKDSKRLTKLQSEYS